MKEYLSIIFFVGFLFCGFKIITNCFQWFLYLVNIVIIYLLNNHYFFFNKNIVFFINIILAMIFFYLLIKILYRSIFYSVIIIVLYLINPLEIHNNINYIINIYENFPKKT
jgi:hypothetical protein